MGHFLYRLPRRFRWTLHNLVAHPVMEILHLLGFEKLSNAVHDSTTPRGPTEPVEGTFAIRREQ